MNEEDLTVQDALDHFRGLGIEDMKVRIVQGHWQFVAMGDQGVGVGCHEDQFVAMYQAVTTFLMTRRGR